MTKREMELKLVDAINLNLSEMGHNEIQILLQAFKLMWELLEPQQTITSNHESN